METPVNPSENNIKYHLLLIILMVVSRIPFLSLGYGSDGDSWRIARSSLALWNDGSYHPSRFPGFPLYEIINAPMVGLGGDVLANSATLVVSLAAVWAFGNILSKLRIGSANLLVWTFAFMPIVWKNSTVSMDYIWGTALVLLFILLVLEKKIFYASIILGLAAGMRFTHLFLIVTALPLLESENRFRRFLSLCWPAAAVTLACYYPVISRPEFAYEIKEYASDIRRYPFWLQTAFFTYRAAYAVGLLASLSLAAGLWSSRDRLKTSISRMDTRFQFGVIGLIVMLGLFFILPDEREYLIPAVPFLLILAGLIFPKRALLVTCFCIFSYSFISPDLLRHGFGRQSFSPHIAAGYVTADYELREKYIETRKYLPNLQMGDSSVVMTGLGPILWLQNPGLVRNEDLTEIFDDDDASVSAGNQALFFVYKLSLLKCQEFKKRGYQIYYLSNAKNYIQSLVGYDLTGAGADSLNFTLLDY